MDIIDKLNDFIEYAEATKKYADVAVHKETINEIYRLKGKCDLLMFGHYNTEMTDDKITSWAKRQVRIEMEPIRKRWATK